MINLMISLCDKSGIMAKPWAENGYICLCVDLQHSVRATKTGKHRVDRFEGGGEIHYLYGDARSWSPTKWMKDFFQKYKIFFVACFPVCTNLTRSGAQDWQLKGIAMLCDGLLLFNACETVAEWSGAPYCLENPSGAIPSHHRKPDFYFHPWMWGDMYQKKTGLWVGNGFKMPIADYISEPNGVTQKMWYVGPGPGRQDERSETPEGFARAVFKTNSMK